MCTYCPIFALYHRDMTLGDNVYSAAIFVDKFNCKNGVPGLTTITKKIY